MSPRVLIFAYFFPPVGGVAVRRTLGFLQRLVDLGWDTCVITPRDPVADPKDERGLDLIPTSTKVKRTGAWEPKSYKVRNYLLIPDEWVGWAPFAARAARAWEYAAHADVIYATAPPYSALLSARAVARSLRVPLVVDFRDPWSLNLSFRRNHWRAWLERTLERWVLQDAAAVVVNTEEAGEAYRERYPAFASKVTVIPNGYDRAPVAASPAAMEGPLAIVHAGTLGGTRVQAAGAFLDALHQAVEHVGSDCFRVRFLGLISDEAKALLESHPAGSLIETVGFMPHDAVAAELASADVLLLLANTESETALHIPAKLYEYMAIERPVLAVAGEGGIRRVIAETGIGRAIEAGRPEEIAGAMLSWLEEKRTTGLKWGGERALTMGYDRECLGARLDALLRRVIDEYAR